MEIVKTDGAGIVSVPAPSKLSKEEWLAKYGSAGGAVPMPMASGNLYSEGYAYGPAGSRSFHTYGRTHYDTSCGLVSCGATFINSSSESSWLGFSPFYADLIDASMKWWVSGINISFSLPPGVGFSRVGSGILWKPGAIEDHWIARLNYGAGIRLNGTVITGVHFTDQADIRINNAWYHVQGN
jgi:hypothetical protein